MEPEWSGGLIENVCRFFCYGDEDNARIYAVHRMTADQSEIRRAYLVSVPVYRLSITRCGIIKQKFRICLLYFG